MAELVDSASVVHSSPVPFWMRHETTIEQGLLTLRGGVNKQLASLMARHHAHALKEPAQASSRQIEMHSSCEVSLTTSERHERMHQVKCIVPVIRVGRAAEKLEDAAFELIRVATVVEATSQPMPKRDLLRSYMDKIYAQVRQSWAMQQSQFAFTTYMLSNVCDECLQAFNQDVYNPSFTCIALQSRPCSVLLLEIQAPEAYSDHRNVACHSQ